MTSTKAQSQLEAAAGAVAEEVAAIDDPTERYSAAVVAAGVLRDQAEAVMNAVRTGPEA